MDASFLSLSAVLPGWWPVRGLWFVVDWGVSAVSRMGWGGLGMASGQL